MESFVVYDISNIKNIHEIYNETKYISCSGVKLNDIYWLKYFPNVDKIFMEFCGLNSLDGIENCKQLIELDITGNNIESLEGLEKCSMLHKLNISNNKISNIDSIKHLYYLEIVEYSIDDINLKLKNILNMINCVNYDFEDDMLEYDKFFSIIDSDMIDYLYKINKLTNIHKDILLENYLYKLKNTQHYYEIVNNYHPKNIMNDNKQIEPVIEKNKTNYKISSG